ncbi:MAG: ABC transporter substrate-binding protein, partial [Candidatus Rokuibacteriota bacterium]
MKPADAHQAWPLDRRDVLGGAAALGVTAGVLAPLRPRPAAAAGETTAKRELVILQGADLTVLDPHGSTYGSDMRVATNVFDTLVRRHPDGTLRPSLATAWRRAGPTTWQVALRPDVRWHDGTPFTAVDAKYSLD